MTHSGDDRGGALRSDQNALIFEEGFSFSGYERDGLYLNLGNRKFLDVSGVSGIDSITDGRGAVFADFDNDGDYDVFLTTIQGSTHLLFRNNIGQDAAWLRIALEGNARNGRDAYGAVVRVKTSAGVLTKIHAGGAGYLSQHDPRLLFGLGSDRRAEWIEVTWPDGSVDRFPGAAAGSTLLLRQGSSEPQMLALGRAQLPDPLSRAETLAHGLKLAIGRPVPDLPLKTLDAKATSLLAALRPGRRTLLNIWATWCAPCAREMPELESLRERLAANGVDVVGLNVDTEPGADVRGFVARTGARYANFVGGVPAIEQIYRTDELSVPISLLLDENGVVLELIPGWSPETRARFAALAGLPSGHPAASK